MSDDSGERIYEFTLRFRLPPGTQLDTSNPYKLFDAVRLTYSGEPAPALCQWRGCIEPATRRAVSPGGVLYLCDEHARGERP